MENQTKTQTNSKFEKRFFEHSLELRENPGDELGSIGEIRGYAAVFDSLSEVLGYWEQFREKVAPGAFSASIKDNDVRAFWSHNPDFVLGRTGNKTLTLEEDSKGLSFTLKLPDTQPGRDALTLIKNRTVTGMSFGFTIRAEEWKRGDKGNLPIRTLKDVDLFEVSPVAFPAYPATGVDARSILIPEAVEAMAKEVRSSEIEKTMIHRLKVGINRLALSIPFDV